jgi:hypothetical protein
MTAGSLRSVVPKKSSRFDIDISVVAFVQFAFNLVQRVEETFRGDGRSEEQDADCSITVTSEMIRELKQRMDLG